MMFALRHVHTVISVIRILGREWEMVQIELMYVLCKRANPTVNTRTLMHSTRNASKAAGIKRFTSVDFEVSPTANCYIDVVSNKSSVQRKIKQVAATTFMEHTSFCYGMFMNHLASGFDFRGDQLHIDEMLKGLADTALMWSISLEGTWLPLKDDGTLPTITMTTIEDVGRFVAAACELLVGRWWPVMSMVGETINLQTANDLIEEIFKNKLQVELFNRESLEEIVDSVPGAGRNPEETLKKMSAQINILRLEDKITGICRLEPVVNNLCPRV